MVENDTFCSIVVLQQFGLLLLQLSKSDLLQGSCSEILHYICSDLSCSDDIERRVAYPINFQAKAVQKARLNTKLALLNNKYLVTGFRTLEAIIIMKNVVPFLAVVAGLMPHTPMPGDWSRHLQNISWFTVPLDIKRSGKNFSS